MFATRNGKFACRHVHNHIRGAQVAFPEVPRLTPEQTEALEYFDTTLAREDLCVHTVLQTGDMQFLNNYTVLHSRTEYEDYPEPERKRHLLRLWLAIPQGQPLPLSWKDAVKDVEARSVRGGFRGIGITPAAEAFEARMAATHGMAFRVYEDRNRSNAGAPTERSP